MVELFRILIGKFTASVRLKVLIMKEFLMYQYFPASNQH